MERSKIGALRQELGSTVKIQGWLHILRDQKRMQFLVVRDMSGMVQVVVDKGSQPAWLSWSAGPIPNQS